MILQFLDEQGSPLAVLASAIVGLSVGRLSGPRAVDAGVDGTTVTVIHTTAGPLMTVTAFEDVRTYWVEALGAGSGQRLTGATASLAHPSVYPLVAHQYPEVLR